jgi:hypothetical protein
MAEKESKKVLLISDESAREQLETLMDFYDIDKDDIEIEEGPEAVQTLMNGLIRAIRKGRLEIKTDSDGQLLVTQHLQHAPGDINTVEYNVVGQKARLAMDRVKSTKEQERMCAFMGSLSGLGVQGVSSLVGADMGTMNRLATLFSMV